MHYFSAEKNDRLFSECWMQCKFMKSFLFVCLNILNLKIPSSEKKRKIIAWITTGFCVLEAPMNYPVITMKIRTNSQPAHAELYKELRYISELLLVQ